MRQLVYGIHSLPAKVRTSFESVKKGKQLEKESAYGKTWQGCEGQSHLVHRLPIPRATLATQLLARIPKSSEVRDREIREKLEEAMRVAPVDPIPEIAKFNSKTIRNRVKTLLHQRGKPWHLIMNDVLDFLESILEDAELIAPLDELLIDEYFEKLEDAWGVIVKLGGVNLFEAGRRKRMANKHIRAALNTLDKLVVENKARQARITKTQHFVREDLESDLKHKNMPIVKAGLFEQDIIQAYDQEGLSDPTPAQVEKIRDVLERAVEESAKGG